MLPPDENLDRVSTVEAYKDLYIVKARQSGYMLTIFNSERHSSGLMVFKKQMVILIVFRRALLYQPALSLIWRV